MSIPAGQNRTLEAGMPVITATKDATVSVDNLTGRTPKHSEFADLVSLLDKDVQQDSNAETEAVVASTAGESDGLSSPEQQTDDIIIVSDGHLNDSEATMSQPPNRTQLGESKKDDKIFVDAVVVAPKANAEAAPQMSLIARIGAAALENMPKNTWHGEAASSNQTHVEQADLEVRMPISAKAFSGHTPEIATSGTTILTAADSIDRHIVAPRMTASSDLASDNRQPQIKGRFAAQEKHHQLAAAPLENQSAIQVKSELHVVPTSNPSKSTPMLVPLNSMPTVTHSTQFADPDISLNTSQTQDPKHQNAGDQMDLLRSKPSTDDKAAIKLSNAIEPYNKGFTPQLPPPNEAAIGTTSPAQPNLGTTVAMPAPQHARDQSAIKTAMPTLAELDTKLAAQATDQHRPNDKSERAAFTTSHEFNHLIPPKSASISLIQPKGQPKMSGPLTVVDKEVTILTAIDAPELTSWETPKSNTLHPTAPLRTDLAPQVARQMVEVMTKAANRPVEIALSPHELGRVRMSVMAEEGVITVSIIAERADTLDLMRRHIDQLGQTFRSMGYEQITFAFGQGANGSNKNTPDGDPDQDPELGSGNIGAIQEPTPVIDLSTAPEQGVDIRL